MKKTVSLVVAALLAVVFVSAQNVADGIKFITYGKGKSALETLQKSYSSNSKDPVTIYWYGQAMLAQDPVDTKAAKALYQKALQDGINDPWIWIGMGHVELLEGADMNAAKQKFEQAITATIEAKGKNKGKANADILNAIGRANADGGSKFGDPNYGIEKLKQAGSLNLTNPEIYVNMGILYQKLGGEMGGEAVKAYTEATTRDPKNANAFWHIGMIYGSQNNKELMEQFFSSAVAADPTYPATYLNWFKYYQNRDVNLAKEYLDKYIQYADKDCKTDFYFADYLFRAGKYQESLDKAKAMDAGDCKTYMMLPILYAFNYDRLADSYEPKNIAIGMSKSEVTSTLGEPTTISKTTTASGAEELLTYDKYGVTINIASTGKVNYINKITPGVRTLEGNEQQYKEYINSSKSNLEKFFAVVPVEKTEPTHYELAVKVFSKFPGLEATTAGFLQKAIDNDTSKENKIKYYKQGADMYGKAKIYPEQVKWLQKYNELKGNMSEFDHYTISTAAYNAMDYVSTMSFAKNYITAFPDKPTGYIINVKAAKALDTTTSPGIAVEALTQQNDYLMKDTAKNKAAIVRNYVYLVSYYNDKVKDYDKALEYVDKMLVLIPGDPDALNYRKAVEYNKNKPQPATKPATKGTTGSTSTPAKPANGGASPK